MHNLKNDRYYELHKKMLINMYKNTSSPNKKEYIFFSNSSHIKKTFSSLFRDLKMELYMYYFIVIKTLVLIGMIMIFLGKVPEEGPVFVLLDTIFKISLGLYIILFFGYNKVPQIDKHDRMLLVISGFILLATIPYKEAFHAITGESLRPSETDKDLVHVVSKPCPPCSNTIQGRPIY